MTSSTSRSESGFRSDAAFRSEVQRFNGEGDFSLWTIRMMAHFGVSGLKEVVLSDNFEIEVPLTKEESKKITTEDDDDNKSEESLQTKKILDPIKLEKDERAKDMIILNISNQVLRKIKHCTTAASMWTLLEKLYMSKSLPNRIFVQSQFYTFKCDSTKTIEVNSDEFLKIVAEMSSLNVSVTDEIQAIVFLNSLPMSYDQLKHTLKYGKDSLTLEEVCSAARSKQREVKEMSKSEKNSGTILYTEDRGRNTRRDSRGGDRQRSKSKGRKITCWYCKKEGHVKKDCYARKRSMEGDSDGEAAVVIEKLKTGDALNVSVDNSNEEWVIDSGCTSHMTCRRDWFIEFSDKGSSKIFLGDYHTVETLGIGTIRVDTRGGSVKLLKNVRYVPTLRRNLLSTGTLDKLGFTHSGADGKIKFHKNGKLALQGTLRNGLYVLDGETVADEVCQAEASTSSQVSIWHSRLGHMSYKNIQVLVKQGYLKKRDVGKEVFCEHCAVGKAKRVSFGAGKHDTSSVLEYIHADLWGSPNVEPSMSGSQYFLSLIDDHSRKVWLCFLKTKDETFQNFCEWKIRVENQVDKRVKYLRTDNGLEFCNKAFNEFCKKEGITRHRTCTYTPQQNGVAERMNRTLMEKVRCLLNESGLDEKFWAEAAEISAYTVNRSPSSSIGFKTPEEVWLGKRPGYKHMRKFGCVAFVYVSQGKLQPRALKGIFIGYPVGTKGYKVWMMEGDECLVSRNVKFQEGLMYKDAEKKREVIKENQNGDDSYTEVKGIEVEEVHKPEHIIQGGAVSTDQEASEEDVSEVSPDEAARSSLSNYQLARDRPRRSVIPPVKYNDYDCTDEEIAFALYVAEVINVEEPHDLAEARLSKEWKKWNSAADDEMDSLRRNGTWVLVDKPANRKIISCRWLFKVKPGIEGIEPERYKVRLVARGFSQKEGIDYQEVFAPVVKHVSIRMLLSLVVNLDLELEQMDVKTAFLHGNLEEDLYMHQPEGYEVKGKEHQVCLLKKSLYGLKQSPRQWNKKFDQFMKSQNFRRSEYDMCVYTKELSQGDCIYLLLYVDDMLIAAKKMSDVKALKDQLSTAFEMKDLGAARRILGIDIIRDRKADTLRLSQSVYLKKVIETYRMSEAKSTQTPIGAHFKLSAVKDASECVDTEVTTYCSAVGSIMYAMVGTRPDLAHSLGLVSRYMSKPGKMHWEAVQWLLKYIKGSLDLGLLYTKAQGLEIQGYCDSDFGGDLDKNRSTSGYVFTVGGNVISWKSSLQSVVALSTTEAEFMALAEAVKESIWLKGLLEDFGFSHGAVKIWCDSQSAICLSKNNVYHERTKHVARKFYFIRDIIEAGEVDVQKIHTSQNPADILTKGVPVSKFKSALDLLKVLKA